LSIEQSSNMAIQAYFNIARNTALHKVSGV